MFKILMAILVIATLVVLGKYVSSPKKSTTQKTTPPKETTNTNNKGDDVDNKLSKYQFPGVLASDKITNKNAIIKTDKGDIVVELYADKAPKSVSNFVYLAEQKFYDGLTFHRVESGFVIQGGDPDGNGSGGPGYKFPDEPVIGEYKAGSLAMANSGPDTNGSQFFICLEDQPNLPKSYNLFGQVISGMDVVKSISVGDKMNSITIVNK